MCGFFIGRDTIDVYADKIVQNTQGLPMPPGYLCFHNISLKKSPVQNTGLVKGQIVKEVPADKPYRVTPDQ